VAAPRAGENTSAAVFNPRPKEDLANGPPYAVPAIRPVPLFFLLLIDTQACNREMFNNGSRNAMLHMRKSIEKLAVLSAPSLIIACTKESIVSAYSSNYYIEI
jgi:hypothetical protein